MKLDNKLLWTCLILMLLVSMTVVTMVTMTNITSASPATHFFVDPPEVMDVPSGGTFLITANVTEAPDSYAWQISLGWNPDLLELVYITEGDFLHRWEWDPFQGIWVPMYDTSLLYTPLDEANAAGEILLSCSLLGDVPWTSGDGWLVSLGFTVEAAGSCVLDLYKTRLNDHMEAGHPAPTYYPNLDGFFSNVDIHDIAVTSVTANTTLVDPPGKTVSINVTVRNEGDYSETFNVTFYADVTIYNKTVDWWPDEIVVGDEITVGTQTVTDLAPGATTTLTLTWNTTGVAAETYYMSANATITSPADDDPRDNMFIDGTVTFIVSHDLKIADVTVLQLEVLQGELANVSVNVLNQGTNPESFTLYVKANETAISIIPDSLDAGADRTYEISWNTTGVAGGTYTISAEVPPVPGEVVPNIANNFFTDGKVRVKTHDLKIADVTVLQLEVLQGELANISVNVLNEGTEPEEFWVYIHANRTMPLSYTIHTIMDSLDAGADRTYEISWNTTGVAEGTYTISAEVTRHPDEVDTADNLFTDVTVTVAAPPVHDVAITNVVPSPTEVTVGDSVTISVDVENEGEFGETFNVNVYYDDTSIDTQTGIFLESGSSTTLTFTWDTTDVAEGTYTIKAEAVVAVDDDTADNLFTDVTVKVREAEAPNILIYAVVGAVAAIAIIAAVIYIVKFRK